MKVSDEDRRFFLESGKLRRYRHGHLLYKQGDDSTCLFLILEGEVEIFVEYGNHRTLVARMGTGDLLGYLALLSGQDQTVCAVTTRNTLLVIISRSAFEQRMNTRPELLLSILHDLATTIGELTLRLSTLPLGAYGRLRFCLEKLACETDYVIEGSWTQQKLAELAGCRRETVAKVMSALRRGQWIRCNNKLITILRPLPEVF